MQSVKLDLDDSLVLLLSEQGGTVERAALELIIYELYRRGVLSRGRSAELLGIPLAEFLMRAGQLGIPYFNMTADDFEAELAAIEAQWPRPQQ